MTQTTSGNDIICPNCGSLNAYHSRVCGSCKSALIEAEASPTQPSALTTARPSIPTPTRQSSMRRVEPLRQTRTTARRVGPAHSLANELRAIASGGRAQEADADKKAWWTSLGIAPVLVAFLGMVGLKGDDVLDNLTDDDDGRKTLFG